MVRTLCLHSRGHGVPSLVKELRSSKPCGTPKKVQIQSKIHYFSSLVSWLTSLPFKWWLKRIISSQIVYIFSFTHLLIQKDQLCFYYYVCVSYGRGAWQATVHGVVKESSMTEQLDDNKCICTIFIYAWMCVYVLEANSGRNGKLWYGWQIYLGVANQKAQAGLGIQIF